MLNVDKVPNEQKQQILQTDNRAPIDEEKKKVQQDMYADRALPPSKKKKEAC